MTPVQYKTSDVIIMRL